MNGSAAVTSARCECTVELLNTLGVGVSPINLETAADRIEDWVKSRGRTYVCVTGVHGVVESQRDAKLRAIHNRAGLVTPDGMPLVRLGRLVGFRSMDRVYGPDLMLEVVLRSVARRYSHYFYGATDATLARLCSNLAHRFPGVRISGVHSPPFRPLTNVEKEDVARRINASSADIVWVGLSTPKQEKWMAEMRSRLEAPVLIGVGAAFDFLAGNVRQAPRWMQRACLEWLFRLCMEPRRLWPRYAVNNPWFVYLVTLQLLRLRRFDLSSD